ncbi:MAG TPA: YetF domain-containing protein [Gemmatimonadaceae bacterium]|nr:YetF domain-containing protein [Gemmatimonadaceae bacterium]
MHPIWNDILTPGVPLLDKVIRTVAVYAFLLVGLRLAGKRELGQLNPFDLVVLLVLSNTVQNAIIGNDNSLVGGLFGATVLVVLNYVVVRFLFLHPRLDRIAEGRDVVLIKDGKLLEKRLRRELITRSELASAARKQGIDDLATVDCARLEVGGTLTFAVKHPTGEEGWHDVITQRMDRLEGKVERVLELLRADRDGA